MARYGAYRGRRRLTPVTVLILILILLIVGIGYFVANGTLSLPQFTPSTADAIPSPLPTLEIIVQDETPSPEIEETVEPIIVSTSLISLSVADLYSGIADQVLADGGAAGGIVTLKDIDGDTSLLYDSQLADAVAATDAPLVAYLSCYRDNTTPYNNNTLAMRTSDGNWWDYDNNRWLSPDSDAVSQYLADLCVLATQMGFDTILLDYAAFPTADMGDADTLLSTERYPVEARTSQLEAFYQILVDTLAPYDVTLAVVLSPDVLEDGGIQSGQNLTLISNYFDAIWVDFSENQLSLYTNTLQNAGISDPTSLLVFHEGGTLNQDSTHVFYTTS